MKGKISTSLQRELGDKVNIAVTIKDSVDFKEMLSLRSRANEYDIIKSDNLVVSKIYYRYTS